MALNDKRHSAGTGGNRVSIKITWSPKIKRALQELGQPKGTKYQKFVDDTVVHGVEPYISYDLGALYRSGIASTVIGSGKVTWSTPYAHRQYYAPGGWNYSNNALGLRGPQWFKRWEADRGEEMVESLAGMVKEDLS